MSINNQSKQVFKPEYLNNCGLNIQSVFNIKDLPVHSLDALDQYNSNTHKFKQLILIGHLGQNLWQSLHKKTAYTEHPIDDHTVKSIDQYFNTYYAENCYEVIYPGDVVIGLQQLGIEAGWHNASPFKVGINEQWGSWFAYRAVILTDTNFETTDKINRKSPCPSCTSKICISSCPASALDNSEFNFDACIEYRKGSSSRCKNTCLARVSCPVGHEYKYSDEQINYHYCVSMKTIEALY